MPSVTVRIRRSSKATPRVKAKTVRSFAKRFSVSANRNILSTQAGKRHNMSQKSKRTLLSQKGKTNVNKSLLKTVRAALKLKLPRKANPYIKKNDNLLNVALPKKVSKLFCI
ncbi:large ribosomal subunit protein bL35 [Candidatus Deianiraea vastatrix]|uniref:50S ribosomal protein L35 n=1 Tax=Candidatus Deianiraea vastatrix TaxID=2163644 RepID=A0A5B8XI47_9RICK|nr:50S ribosomal protein L35 [Candidatus Deianiraea vastatrix]QED23417.1 50S ribosomal protein L35 [Candidatus Deianiraea vastatrix]